MKEEKYILDKVGKENHFRVPNGYFENFASELMSRLPEHEVIEVPAAKPRVFVLRSLILTAACVCVAIFSITLFFMNDKSDEMPTAGNNVVAQNNIDYSTVDEYIDDAADYAMMDHADIYAYLSSEN